MQRVVWPKPQSSGATKTFLGAAGLLSRKSLIFTKVVLHPYASETFQLIYALPVYFSNGDFWKLHRYQKMWLWR